MTDRRFNEAEVATIIERATVKQEGGRQLAAGSAGLTLGELQEIGRDVGIDPRDIAEAAESLDRPAEATTTRGFLGIPLRVERVVPLDRRLTDDEWERVVVDLRETFDARGVMKGEGSLRQWTNGNLQALLEPTTKGQRVRLRTYKGDAAPGMIAGLALIVVPGVSMATALLTGAGEAGDLATFGALAAGGVGLIGVTAARVSRWARERAAQMEGLAARIRNLARSRTDS